jgi:purine-nucleoside phosphorylase
MLKGRLHTYEGHALPVAGLPARILCALGIRVLVVTNAAGGIDPSFLPGDLMLVRDHINLLGGSPLEGVHVEEWGPRFPDMSRVYPGPLRDTARTVAESMGIALREGVYAAVRGPQYETPAEVRMLGILGADAVGMSTVPESIVAAQMGVGVLGISLIANAAAGLSPEPLKHEEVLEIAGRAGERLGGLIERLVPALVRGGEPAP